MLKGEIRSISEYSEDEISKMYSLMEQFYENTTPEVFRRDFFAKDFCLSLWNESEELVGFTTQKVIEISVEGKPVHGVFSGDTIIHSDYWGSTELFKVFSKFWFNYAEKYDEFYWFLICKGYKTYRIMPVFFEKFYPNCRYETPEYEKKIIDAYASYLYPDEYDAKSGVIVYKSVKDRLRSGVADVGDHELKNKDIAFFCKANPDYIKGNDIACLLNLKKSNLKKRMQELLLK